MLLVVSYRIALHPLKSFPGPLIAKFTSAYSALYIWKRDFHLASVQWHKKYGKHNASFSSPRILLMVINN
jgi:hypothetical protein